MPMKKTKLYIFYILIFAILLTPSFLYSADGFFPSQVKDISDRKYEPAVIQLLDNAKESIFISMYSVNLDTEKRNPVTLLRNNLLKARARNVSVTLYLNTCFERFDQNNDFFSKNLAIKELEDAGCVIHLMTYKHRLHDKLIIVDKRYIVEGSTNWSIAALKDNYESSTLIDSPELASVKLERLEKIKNIISLPNNYEKISYVASYLENLPENLAISKELLLNKKYFPDMLSQSDNRSMDFYLLLLAHSQVVNKQEFFISLEAMGLSLGMNNSWSYTDLRRQVIKSLNKLQNRYNLIEVKYFYGRDAFVKLIPFVIVNTPSVIASEAKQSQSVFFINSAVIINKKSSAMPLRLKFLFLIEALLKEEGKDLHSITQPALSKRFNIYEKTLERAFKDMREYK